MNALSHVKLSRGEFSTSHASSTLFHREIPNRIPLLLLNFLELRPEKEKRAQVDLRERFESDEMERSSSSSKKATLHNFSFSYLRWGNQKLLRCVKVGSPSSNGGARGSPTREKAGTLFPSSVASRGTQRGPVRRRGRLGTSRRGGNVFGFLENEEDFMEMVRNRPPRRPKKRTRVVQKVFRFSVPVAVAI